MGQIVGGLALLAAGTAVIYYHNQLYQMFGDIERAEKNLGESRIVYVLFGMFIIVIGILVLFGVGGNGINDADEVKFAAESSSTSE